MTRRSRHGAQICPAAYVGSGCCWPRWCETSEAVASTRSRLAKVARLADLLRRLAPDEVEPAVGFLTGRPVRARSASAGPPCAGEPPPRRRALHRDPRARPGHHRPQAMAGQGSGARRHGPARRPVRAGDRGRGRIRPPPPDRRAAPGGARGRDDRRRGPGVGHPAATVRRAAMFAGDLARVAAVALADGEPGCRVGLEVLRPCSRCWPRRRPTGGGPRRCSAVLGRVEARRRPHPGPPPGRRGAPLHPEPQRRDRSPARVVDLLR